MILVLLSSSLISQRSDRNYPAFKAAYKTFLQNVTCDTANVEFLEAFFPFDTTSFSMPGFGMNGKMDYSDNDTLTDDFERKRLITYNEQLLKDAIIAVGPDYLRFPGGTVASGYQIYPKKSNFTAGTVTHEYFLLNADADSVPVCDTSYVYSEGASFKKGQYFEPEIFLNEHCLSSTESLINFTSTLKSNDTIYDLNLDRFQMGITLPTQLFYIK